MKSTVTTLRAHAAGGIALLLIGLMGCEQKDARAASTSEQSSLSKAAPSPQAGAMAQPSYDEEAFSLSITGPKEAKAGQSVELQIQLAPKNGFKINEEYPVKFRAAQSAGVSFERETVDKSAAVVEKSHIEMPVQVLIEKPGAHRVEGKLSFSVCTEDRCLIEKRDLGVSITAS